MSAETTFQMSAPFATGVSRALVKLGQLDAVLAEAKPEVATMLRHPDARPWWPGELSIGMTEALAAAGGSPLVRQVGRLTVAESLGPLVRPLIAAVSALTGISPATYLGRFNQLAMVALKNITTHFTPTGPNGGTFFVTYPVEVPAPFVEYWLGTFDYIFDLSHARGRVDRAEHRGATLHFELAWE